MHATLACLNCDLLSELGELGHGEVAICPRCGQSLTRQLDDANHRLLSFTVAALIFLALANSGPLLSFGVSGLEGSMFLLETPQALWTHDMPMVALLIGALILLIPGIVMALLLLLGVAMELGFYRPWLPAVARGIFQFQHWSMVEVFLIGVLVSLVKLSAMASVVIGTALWAYVAFMICFILANASLDRYQCWEWLEQMRLSGK